MAKTLELYFGNEEKKRTKISMPDPREDLEGSDVKAVMDMILAKNIFDTSGGDIVRIDSAKIVTVERVEEELELVEG